MTQKEYHKQWYRKNRAKKIAEVRQWQASNKDKTILYSRKWNTANREYFKQWYLDKKEFGKNP